MNRTRIPRRPFPILLLALCAAGVLGGVPLSAQATAAPAAVPPASGALAVVERFERALQSGDRDGVLACLAPEVVIFEHGGAELSRDEYAHHHLGGDLDYLRGTATKRTDRKLLDGGDRVVVLTRSETRGDYKGKPVASAGTETLVLERRGDDWTITHVHWSSHKL
jgi:ketosteroid isomerase-like protein